MMREEIEKQNAEAQEPESKIWEIPTQNWTAFKARFDRLAGRAQKLGVKPPNLEILGEGTKEIEVEWGKEEHGGIIFKKFWIKVRRVQVTGEAPKLAGYSFAGTIEHLGNGNLLRAAPDQEIPKKYRTGTPTCDHCGTARRRKDTFIVKTEAGEYQQVGRSCLRDFLGHVDPEHVALLASIFRFEPSERDLTAREPRGGFSVKTRDYLAWVAMTIRDFGWKSAGTAREKGGMSTSDIAWTRMCERKRGEARPEQQDQDATEAALTWLAGEDASSDFIHNLKTALAEELLEPRRAGIAAAVFVAQQNANGRRERLAKARADREAHAAARKAQVDYHGAIGDRVEIEGTVTFTREFDSDWGTSTLIAFETDSANFAWFASKVPATAEEELAAGARIKVRATVKAHQIYRGEKQTQLTRGKILELTPAPAPRGGF